MADGNASADTAAPAAVSPAAAAPTDRTRANGDNAAAPSGRRLKPVQLALFAGWTTAVLYGTLPGDPTADAHNADDVQTARAPAALGKPEDDAAAPAADGSAVLPALEQLPPQDRRKLELARLRHLLAVLLPDFAGISALTAGDLEDKRAREEKVASLNLDIMTALTAKQPEIQLAYELGRSLRDTANPPDGTAKSIAEQLAHRRIAKLQDWLVALSPEFPQLTAAVVAGSLGRWSDLASVTVVPNSAGQARVRVPGLQRLPAQDRRAPIAESMCSYLLQQGDVWLMLLIGELATSGLLTPEGYVTAGEAALRRSGAIVRGIIRHYWFGLLSVAAALGGILFLAARYLEGGSKVWTSIAAIAGSLGISAQTIALKSSRLTAEAAKPVLTMAEEDAMAWAITTLPPLTLTFRGVRHLRRAGVAPTASLSRF